MRPLRMTALIGGKRYSTDLATLIADDAEQNPEGKSQFLFRTKAGDYFVQHRTYAESCFDAAHDWMQPMSEVDALMLYWELPERLVPVEQAFPK
ncbi:MAG: hypothetical protein AAB289_16655 [Chloroflexota bacterium]